MQLSRMNAAPRLIPLMFGAKDVPPVDFWLIDVGASGGLDAYWRLWAKALHAICFDPLVKEIERLTTAEVNPNIRYEAALVICPTYDAIFSPSERENPVVMKDNSPRHRSSSYAATKAMKMDRTRDIYNAGFPVELSDRRINLDDYVEQHGIPFVDFLKIDTDGHDIEVLLGAEKMLTSRRVLGVVLETHFHGPLHYGADTFANADLFLRSHGYSLYDLGPYRQSRRDLPAKFVYPTPAQTISGQLQWADALYFRDFSNPHYEEMFGMKPTAQEIMKLACLFELFGLPDCAAELLILHRGLIDPLYQVDTLLDALVSDERIGKSIFHAYRPYMDAFYANPKAFYPTTCGEPAGILRRTKRLVVKLACSLART
jgi:FkbM family methyltransferase